MTSSSDPPSARARPRSGARNPIPSAPSRADGYRQAIGHALDAFQRGAWQEAEHVCRTLLANDGEYGPALHLLGVIAGQTRRTHEAVALLSKAAAVDPRNAEAHHHRGVALGALGRFDEALASYDRALQIDRDNADALFNRGTALVALGRCQEALASLDRCVELAPGFAPAHNRRAMALVALGGNERALASADRALALRADYIDAYVTRGMALRALHRPALALESHDRALALAPDLPEAWSNRGNALADLSRYDEAIRSYERSLALRPGYADARFNLSLCDLLRGDFARGWEGYESRPPPRHVVEGLGDVPRWRGEADVRGRAILLHAEQGLGDTLQFCRYVPQVAALGATVVLQVQPTLVRLLQSLEGATRVVGTGEALPAVDVRDALLSLPRAFATELASIPAAVPYLRSDPARAAAWQARLGPRTKPRVGLAWSGNPEQARDYSRSMRFVDVLPLLVAEVEWISLQKDVRATDAEALAAAISVRDVRDELHDFVDTAALIDVLDLVVTVDTSVAHLTGAIGRQAWILLAFNPDWRWLLDRDDSPWYPGARLFRQPAPGDWASVAARVRDELRRRFG